MCVSGTDGGVRADCGRRTRRRVIPIESMERRLLLSAGDLDPTFGDGGEVLLPAVSGSLIEVVNATAVQPDGKILIAGSAGTFSESGQGDFFLERLNSDGSVDTSFGAQGVSMTDFGGVAQAKAILIQPDGKIVLGGPDQSAYNAPQSEFALARYNPDGSPDTSFGTGGKVLTQIPGKEDLQSIALVPDGKILAAGPGTYQDPAHPMDASYSTGVIDVARYNSDGSLDTSFSGSGYIYRHFESSLDDSFHTAAVAVQGDGKVLVGSGFKIDFAVWRFNVDGSLDTSFGLGGMGTIPFYYGTLTAGGFYSYGSISNMTIQPDGKILVAGPESINADGGLTWAIGRYNSDGSVDDGFGSRGLVGVNQEWFFGHPGPANLLLQSDGKIIMGGRDVTFGTLNLILDRYLPDGSRDPTFHSSDIPFSGDSAWGSGGLALSPDGTVLLASTLTFGLYRHPQYQAETGLARVQGDLPVAPATATASDTPAVVQFGDLDPTFGFQGRTVVNDPSPVSLPDSIQHRAKAVAVQSDGKILIAGSTGTLRNGGAGDFYLQRLNHNGSIDPTFGNGKSVDTHFGPVSFSTSLLIQPDGKIVGGGATEDSATSTTNADFALARYNRDGSLDSTFGSGGEITTDFPGNEKVDALALAPGGKIVAAGAYFLYPNVGFEIARYNANGSLDTSFNSTGMLAYALGETGGDSYPVGVAVQSDGKIIVGAHLNNSFAVFRFNADGAIDKSFGSSGVATTAGALDGAVMAVALQPDGRILAGGPTTGIGYGLTRFDVNGGLDVSFGSKGIVTVTVPFHFGPSPNTAYPIAGLSLQPDGEIILAGSEQSRLDMWAPGAQFLVRRFLPDGTPDPTFQNDQDPAFMPPPPLRGAVAEGAALGPDGNLVVAGDVWADGEADATHELGVARYLIGSNHFVVTSLADDGSVGTLRWAVREADNSAGGTIDFPGGLSGTISVHQTLSLGSGTGPIMIRGPKGGSVTITSEVPPNNATPDWLSVGGSFPITISGLTITGGTGRGIDEYDGIFTVIGCTFAGNFGGPAITNGESSNGGQLSISDSTFTGDPFGAIYNYSRGTLNLTACTICGNGGIAIAGGGMIKIGETIVAGNTHDVSGPVTSLGYNLIGNAAGSSGWIASDLTGTSANPLDPKLAPLGDYGGPTPTMALLAGSPALKHGGQFPNLATDQRGYPRVFGTQADTGAYEAQPPNPPGDVNHDGTVGFADLVILARNYGSSHVPLYELGDLNGDGIVNFADLVILAHNYGRRASMAEATLSATLDLKRRRLL